MHFFSSSTFVRQINIDLDDDKIENVVCLPKKSNKYETLEEFFATDVELQKVKNSEALDKPSSNEMQITLIPPKIEETKKEENKQYNFNFDELDDMGEVLDFDLDGNTDENTLISNYFGSQDKNKHKSDFERNDSTLVKNSTEINNQKQSIVSDQIGSSQLEQFFNKNYNFDEGRCANPEYDPLNIALKKTKSQNLNFSELGFSNSRSLQTLNHHQKDQILLQLLKERGSFQEKLRLAESEIMDKEYHIECMMKGGNVLPLDMTQARLHLAFLFSSPLIRRTNSSIENIMQLDYLTEIDDILKVCSRRKYEMKYKIDVATVSNLRSTITDWPVALHFSGHGIENTPENLGSEYAIFKGRGNILLLEDEHGMADYFFEEDLKHMIEMSKNTFEVVFVSSWYSQFAGEVFLNAGAKHVICIKSGERISDKASLRFSRVFYETLFVKNYNVWASFNIAKEEISKVINSSEASKFILLIQDKDTQFFRAKNSHKWYALSNYQPGVLTNIDNKPIFDSNPSNVDCFVGRQQDMYEIINLLDYHRLVSILGPPGIGKTSISRNIANYLKDRKKFRDGIIYVTLRGCESAQMFMTRLSLIIRSAWSLEEYKKYGLEEIDKRNSAKDEWQKNEIDESKYRNFILNMLKEREVLLILDNAEDPLEDDNAKFINGLELILDNCSKVKFLVTTRKTINKLAHNQEKPYILQPLSKEASLKLLITKSPRDIKNMELQELLTWSIPKNWKIGQNLNVKLVNQHEKCTLLDHPFTALLGGHPQAISLAAPLLEYKSLKRLFYAFCDSNLMDALDYPTSTQDPNKSLRLSLELSINHMKNTMPEALNLFGFIGLFPGGVSDDQITQMWENTQWMSLKDALVRASLLVYKTDSKGTFIYSMLPFMSIRAYELLEWNEELRHTYHMKWCKLFNDECYDIYISDKSIDKIEKLVGMETNIWACIYRSLNRKKIIEYENDDLKSNLSDYFTSDNEKSAERLSVPKFNPKKYKEKEEKNTMEQLVEEENESSSSSDESDNINITNLVKVTEVNRSNERTYQSHFQLSPKESNKEVNQSWIDKEQDRDQQITSQRRQRRRKVGHVEKQKRSRYFNEEMLVIQKSN